MSFKSGSAGGLDGLSPQHLKDLMGGDCGTAGSELLKDNTALINLMLAGEVVETITDILYGAKKVINELRKPERHDEIEKHGRSYACCIFYLSLLEKYPIDLMSHALSPDFLKRTYGKPAVCGKEILGIHTTAAIFCPEAKMNRLTDKSAILLAKKYSDFVPNEDYVKQYNITESMFLDIKKILKGSRGGAEYVFGDHIVPHHQRGDIIICNDHKGSPVEIPESFKKHQFGLVHRVPDDNQWIVLVIAGKNAFIYNSDQATGPFLTKIRELTALGYHAALVKGTTYVSLGTREEKLNYINNIINDALKINPK